MDSITGAILATLPALATDVVKTSVKDAYSGLKAVIVRKWGHRSKVVQAVEALEKEPQSERQASVLAESIKRVKAAEDPDIQQVLARLQAALRKEGIGVQPQVNIGLTITGGSIQGVVGAASVSISSMSFQAPAADEDQKAQKS